MFSVANTVKRILNEQGRTQSWVIQRMNSLNPTLAMDRSKFSCIITGRRKMTGDELLTFCRATEVSPDEFLQEKVNGMIAPVELAEYKQT